MKVHLYLSKCRAALKALVKQTCLVCEQAHTLVTRLTSWSCSGTASVWLAEVAQQQAFKLAELYIIGHCLTCVLTETLSLHGLHCLSSTLLHAQRIASSQKQIY